MSAVSLQLIYCVMAIGKKRGLRLLVIGIFLIYILFKLGNENLLLSLAGEANSYFFGHKVKPEIFRRRNSVFQSAVVESIDKLTAGIHVENWYGNPQ